MNPGQWVGKLRIRLVIGLAPSLAPEPGAEVFVSGAITATGSGNVITYRSGAPEIDNDGMDNTILPG